MDKFIFLDRVDSTNTYLLNNDYPDGTVCASLNQTAGRGRSGRKWITAPGDCLALSVQLQNISASKLMGAQTAAGYAITEALMPYIDARLKWPNDLVFKGKKLAGMLIETKFSGNTLNKAVFGVGININTPPAELAEQAIAIKDIYKGELDTHMLIYNAVALLEDKMEQYVSGNLDIASEWPHYSANYMKQISIHINGSKTSVQESGITERGYLIADNSKIITEGEIDYDFGI